MENPIIYYPELQDNKMKKMVIAWDLDGTLICSKHRSSLKEDGTFDLEAWRAKCIPEFINQDTLLPLADAFFENQKTGYTQIAVTARDMVQADFDYLKSKGMHFDMILHRKNSDELDEVLKNKRLQDFLNKEGRIPFMAFDDKEENLAVFDRYGFRTFNAKYMNYKLAATSYEEIAGIKPKDF